MRLSPLAALGIVVLVVSTGCLGQFADPGQTTTPEVTPTAETPSLTAPGSATTQTSSSSLGEALQPPLDVDTIKTAHVDRLATAGSFNQTIRQHIRLVADQQDQTQTTTQVSKVDLDQGIKFDRLAETVGAGTARRQAYRTPSGRIFTRDTTVAGKSRILPARNASDELTADRYEPSFLDVVANVSLDHATRTTDGSTRHVYTASGATTMPELLLESLEIDQEHVTEFSLRMVVTDRGLVEEHHMTIGYTKDGRDVTITQTMRYADVGSTTVPTPDWIDEAREKTANPGSTDVISKTTEQQGFTLVVQAKKSTFRHETGPNIEISENPMYYNDFLNESRVSPVVRLYWPDETRSAAVMFEYDPSKIPGHESDLRVVRNNRTTQLLEPLNTAVDTDTDTVTARVTAQGRTYFVIDYRVYIETLRNQTKSN